MSDLSWMKAGHTTGRLAKIVLSAYYPEIESLHDDEVYRFRDLEDLLVQARELEESRTVS
jgi:hypothetical protein